MAENEFHALINQYDRILLIRRLEDMYEVKLRLTL